MLNPPTGLDACTRFWYLKDMVKQMDHGNFHPARVEKLWVTLPLEVHSKSSEPGANRETGAS